MEQKYTEDPVSLLCMIRHGERCDKSDDEQEKERALANSIDPPLTEVGISQARICGQS